MNGLKNRSISHSFLNPEFMANFSVQKKHQHQWKKEEYKKNKGRIYLLINWTGPFFQATNIHFFIQKVIFNL